MLNIILYEPEIPPNTGNIMRLCANIGAKLHLIKPYGFDLSEKNLKRARLDYYDFANIIEYENFTNFLTQNKIATNNRLFCTTTKTNKLYSDINYQIGDYLLFGPETRGLPKNIRDKYPCVTLPMVENSRSLNLSNVVAVIAYEMWRQLKFINY